MISSTTKKVFSGKEEDHLRTRLDFLRVGEGLLWDEPDLLCDRGNHFQDGEDRFHAEVTFLRSGPDLLRFRDDFLCERNNSLGCGESQGSLIRHRVAVATGIGA